MMVTREGLGDVAPKRVRIEFTQADLHLMRDAANRRLEYRQYSQKKSLWANGMIRGQAVQHIGEISGAALAILTGMVGEYGLAAFIHRSFPSQPQGIDLVLREDGDGGFDLNPFGYSIDVKTRRRNPATNLVRAENEWGRVIPIKSNAFTFCYWRQLLWVELIGWIDSDSVRNWRTQPGVAGHLNYVGGDDDLMAMTSLIDRLNAAKDLGV